MGDIQARPDDVGRVAAPLASPAMGHWGTCPLDFQLVKFWDHSLHRLLYFGVILHDSCSFQNALKHVKSHKIAYKTSKNRLRMGLRSRPRWESLRRSPDPLIDRDRINSHYSLDCHFITSIVLSLKKNFFLHRHCNNSNTTKFDIARNKAIKMWWKVQWKLNIPIDRLRVLHMHGLWNSIENVCRSYTHDQTGRGICILVFGGWTPSEIRAPTPSHQSRQRHWAAQ